MPPENAYCPDCESDDIDLSEDEQTCVCAECGHTWPAFVDDDGDLYDDPMDGDHESALASAGFGTDEDYGSFGGDDPEGY